MRTQHPLSELFMQLYNTSQDDLIREIADTYANNVWREMNVLGALTCIGNLAQDVGELEMCQMAREMRDELKPKLEMYE